MPGHRLPIRWLIPIALSLFSGLLLLVSYTIEEREFHQEARQRLIDQARYEGYRLAAHLESRLRAGDMAGAAEEFVRLATLPQLALAYHLDAQGHIQLASEPRLKFLPLTQVPCADDAALLEESSRTLTSQYRFNEDGHSLCLYSPVRPPPTPGMLRPDQTGHVVLYFNDQSETLARGRIFTRVAAMAAALLVLAGLLGYWLKRRLADRIDVLAAAIQSGIETGQAPPCAPQGGDEIDQLTSRFVGLARQLAERNSELAASAEALRHSEERFDLAMRGANDGLWDWDLGRDTVYYSPRWKSMLGYPETEIGDSPDEWRQRVHPDDLPEVLDELQRHLEGVTPQYEATHRLRHKQGHWVWILTRGQAQRDDQGQAIRLVGTHTDLSERIQAEEAHRLAASVFDNIIDGLMITDPEGTILRVNAAFSDITGYSAAEAIGQTPALLKSGRHDQEFYERLWQDLRHRGHWLGEIWNRRKNGEIYPERLAISAVHDQRGQVSHYVGLFVDITPLMQRQHTLERMAHFDALTGLPNRLLLSDRLEQTMARCRRQGDLLAVGFLDLDGFKPINDQYGHETGDRLLVEIASRLRAAVREGDTVARVGGDEFVLLLGNITSEAELGHILERLLASLAMPCRLDGIELNVSASLGVTLYPRDEAEADGLLRHADQAMYEAKQGGRAHYRLYDSGLALGL